MKRTFDFTKETMVIVLILLVGVGTTTCVAATAHAQIDLEKPFYVETEKIIAQKEIGANSTQLTILNNGMLKENIEIINTGHFVGISEGNNVTSGQGQGVLTTKDGSEKANYIVITIGNVTEDGKPTIRGSAMYETNSTGKLAFLDNMVTVFKTELDENGNLISKEWEWK
jgi:hypothetical protein